MDPEGPEENANKLKGKIPDKLKAAKTGHRQKRPEKSWIVTGEA